MKFILLGCLFALPFISFAQSFSNPESVEYDTLNHRWLVGNNSSGKVYAYSPSSGTKTLFCSGMTSGPYGIEVLGNVLYCCDGNSIKGYSLSSGAMVFNVNLNATFLNGITSDGNHTIYTTDFTAKKIYRLNMADSSYNVMASTILKPNGIIYDGAHNRCVFVNWGVNAPVQALNIADSAVTTLANTSLSNCDGIMHDAQYNWYVSSWGNNALNKFDSTFSSAPSVVMNGLSQPADLGINAAHDSIGIPNSSSVSTVVFYRIPADTTVPNGLTNVASRNSVSVYPNPADDRIMFTLDEPLTNGTMVLTDMTGRMLISQRISGYEFLFERGELAAGCYSVVIKNESGVMVGTKQLIVR